MTRGVEGKPVYQPIKVDTNSTATAGTDQSGAGRGAFGSPSPNTRWLPPVSAEAQAKRANAVANGTAITIGDSDARREHARAIKEAKDAALSTSALISNQQAPESSDDSTSALGDTVEEAAESSKAALKDEAKHDDEVAARRMQELKDLHQDLQLSTTGTTAPVA